MLGILVGYPIYKDQSRKELVSNCNEFRDFSLREKLSEVCKDEGFRNTDECKLPDDTFKAINNYADIQEEACIKQDWPSKYDE